MNPGGDYGKRELSPALVNRFTSVWVPPTKSLAELEAILRSHLEGERSLSFFDLSSGPVRMGSLEILRASRYS